MIHVLFIGDIVGKIGRQACKKLVPKLKKKYQIDLVIANAENAAHGNGITKKIYEELRSFGIDFMTLGDHAFDRSEVKEILTKRNSALIRPANYPPENPGRGYAVIEVMTKKLLLVNLIGRVFMKMHFDCPFRSLDAILSKYQHRISAIIVDFHAEATSEKSALFWYADGRVSAVLGTHTHIPTADGRISPKGTALVTDVGMVGAKNSVIGVKKENAIQSYLTQQKTLLEPVEEGECIFNAVLLKIDTKSKKTVFLQRLDREIEI